MLRAPEIQLQPTSHLTTSTHPTSHIMLHTNIFILTTSVY